MKAKTILQRLATEEDARNSYITFTAYGDGYEAAANVFTESANVTGYIEDGGGLCRILCRSVETYAPRNYRPFRGMRRCCRGLRPVRTERV